MQRKNDYFIDDSKNKSLHCTRDIAVSDDKLFIIGSEDDINSSATVIWVYEIQKETLKFLFRICGPFTRLRGLTIDSDGCIYTSDIEKIIFKISLSSGEQPPQINVIYAHWRDEYGGTIVNLNFPNGLRVNSQLKLLYVCDADNSQIQIFDLDLNLKYRLGGESPIPIGYTIPKQFLYFPFDIAIDGSNTAYITDKRKNTIVKIEINFNKFEYKVTPTSINDRKLRGIVTFNNGIIVADRGNNAILYLDDAGNIKDTIESGPEPKGVAVFENKVYVCSLSFVETFRIENDKIVRDKMLQARYT